MAITLTAYSPDYPDLLVFRGKKADSGVTYNRPMLLKRAMDGSIFTNVGEHTKVYSYQIPNGIVEKQAEDGSYICATVYDIIAFFELLAGQLLQVYDDQTIDETETELTYIGYVSVDSISVVKGVNGLINMSFDIEVANEVV